MNRRQFGWTCAGLSAAAVASPFAGVTVGIQTYSFRDRPFAEAIQAMVAVGATECELSGAHAEPFLPGGDKAKWQKLREWRVTAPIQHFEDMGKQLRAAGITPSYFTYNFMEGSDAELARGFEMARALGAKGLSMSTRVSLAPRIDAMAKREKMRVGLHNHSRIQPDQLATPEDFTAALKGRSDYLAVTLDVGHYVAAGFDPVEFMRERHDVILNMHLKDRKKNQGPPVALGEGDTPLIPLLRLVRDRKYAIPGFIEHEYQSPDPVAAVRQAFDYCKRALLA